MTPTPGSLSSGVGAPSLGASSSLPENTSASNQSHNQSSGLSTGAKIGLGIGIPVAVLLGLALAYTGFGRRMHRSTGSGAVADEEGYSQAEVVDEGRGKDEVGHESRSEPVYEPVYELDNEADRQVELPAGRS
jgi:hypothetical protein